MPKKSQAHLRPKLSNFGFRVVVQELHSSSRSRHPSLAAGSKPRSIYHDMSAVPTVTISVVMLILLFFLRLLLWFTCFYSEITTVISGTTSIASFPELPRSPIVLTVLVFV